MNTTTRRIRRFVFLTCACISIFLTQPLLAKGYNVTDFGAVNDGKTMNTAAIQKAIDQCAKDGGGTVMLSGGGKFMTGTLYLKDNVTLHIDNGTTLLGSRNVSDYAVDTYKCMYTDGAVCNQCLIFAKDAKSIAIEGHGTIDGNGHQADSIFGNEKRPMLIRFMNCSNIHLTDVNIINPASWTSSWL